MAVKIKKHSNKDQQ